MTIPTTIAEFDVDWFNRFCELGNGVEVKSADAERIAVGEGFMGELARVTLGYAGPPGPSSVIVKIPTTDSGLKPVGVMLGVYERESRFYNEVMPHLSVRTARCLYNGADAPTESYALVLEDLGHLEGGNQVAGMGIDQARACIRAAAGIHGRWWDHDLLVGLDWVPAPDNPVNMGLQGMYEESFDALMERWGHLYPTQIKAEIERYIPHISSFLVGLGEAGRTLTHNDFRLDNLFFDGDEVVVLDWQVLGLGDGMGDLVPLLTTNISEEVRQAHEADLLRFYFDEMRAQGSGTSHFEDLVRMYRANQMFWLINWGNNAARANPGERSDALMEAVLRRCIAAAVEHQPWEVAYDVDWRPRAD
ncbi:MAG: phosphotransferase [Acidimicrobiales bacterium]